MQPWASELLKETTVAFASRMKTCGRQPGDGRVIPFHHECVPCGTALGTRAGKGEDVWEKEGGHMGSWQGKKSDVTRTPVRDVREKDRPRSAKS